MANTIWTSYSRDGATFGLEQPMSLGEVGEFRRRVIWRQQGHFSNFRVQKFRGTAPLTIARLEVEIEVLNV